MKNIDKAFANASVLLREEFDDWAVLLDTDTGRGFGLNPTGIFVRKLFDGERVLDGLLQETRHGIDNVPEEATAHVREFVDDLVAQGLAGVERTVSGPAESSLHPPDELNGMMKLNYERPRLINLSVEKPATGGSCCPGSTNAASCTSGGCAINGCYTGTSASGANCNTGILATGDCWTGNSPNSNCNCGTYPNGHNSTCLNENFTLCCSTGSTALH